MQTVTLISAFVLAAVVLLTAPPAVDAACCPSNLFICRDGTTGTPYCGHGKCDFFGCNCDGGCRTRQKKRSIDETLEIGSARDLNGDGLLFIEEAETVLEQGPNAAHRSSVRSLDKNMDGMLSVDEIDN